MNAEFADYNIKLGKVRRSQFFFPFVLVRTFAAFAQSGQHLKDGNDERARPSDRGRPLINLLRLWCLDIRHHQLFAGHTATTRRDNFQPISRSVIFIALLYSCRCMSCQLQLRIRTIHCGAIVTRDV